MDSLYIWIGVGLATGATVLLLLVNRGGARQDSRPQAELRREWSQARPNWQGHEGWGGRE